MKSAVVMISTDVSRALRINLKHLPISFLLILLTAQISLNVRGTPSCLDSLKMGLKNEKGEEESNGLPAGDVETSRCDGIVTPALQIFAVVDLFEKIISSVHNCPGQVDSIGHVADFFEGVYQSSVGATHLHKS